MKALQRMAQEQKKLYYSLYLFSALLGAVIIFQAYFIAKIVDQVFLKEQTFSSILFLLFALLGVFLLRVLLHYANGQVGIRMSAKVKKDYRIKLIQHHSTLLSSYQGQSGEKVSLVLDAVDEVDSFFSKYVIQRVLASIVPLLILIVIFTQHLYSGLIILITAPFIPIFMIIIGRSTQQKADAQLDSLTSFSGRFLDTLQGLISIRLYGQTKEYKEKIKESSLNFRDATMDILKVAFTSSFMLELISMLSIGLVALELSLRLIIFGQINFFIAFFILLLVPEFFVQLKELGGAFHAGRGSASAAKKIESFLNKEREEKLEWGERHLVSHPVALQLKDVHFSYDHSFALHDINVKIPAKSNVAIVGKSGSGKTTLLHLLSGLIPAKEGELLVDGHPLVEYREEDWYNQISYITQHPYLFRATIAENISLGLDRTMEEIKEAITKAGLDSWIESLPHGLETEIGEGGRGISGGEKQRIALARAFLKKPNLILFDEPTTGLDLYTEKILQSSIQELSKNCTMITVAHRLQTIKHASHIICLDQGKVMAQGTHAHLIVNSDSYRQLFQR